MFYFLFSKHISSLSKQTFLFFKTQLALASTDRGNCDVFWGIESLIGFCAITFRKGCRAMDATYMTPHRLRPHTSGQQTLAELNAVNLKMYQFKKYTCTKSILWHLVPLVNVLKDAMPSSTPEGAVRKATQLTTKDPFVPGPDSNTHTWKLYPVTSAVQTTAESWTLTAAPSLWLVDAKIRIFEELENTWGYCTMLQWRKPCDDLVTFASPLWRRFCPEREKK